MINQKNMQIFFLWIQMSWKSLENMGRSVSEMTCTVNLSFEWKILPNKISPDAI